MTAGGNPRQVCLTPYAVIEGAILILFPNQFTKKRIDIPAKYDIILESMLSNEVKLLCCSENTSTDIICGICRGFS